MVHWIYVLACEDDFIYVGETEHLYARFKQHLSGRGATNTHIHRPHSLIGLYKLADNYSFMEYRNAIRKGEDDTSILGSWGNNESGNLIIENHITERLLYERRNNHEYGSGNEWYRIRGGKYTREDMIFSLEFAKEWCSRPNRIVGSYKSTTPIRKIPEDDIVDRPLCKCGMPSEVKMSKDKTKIYFVCALKNAWPDIPFLKVGHQCDFWELYNNGKKDK
jgi:predicted GIY-YIG superfamily endonuclease